MILRLPHFLVAIPFVHHLVQKLAGREERRRQLRIPQNGVGWADCISDSYSLSGQKFRSVLASLVPIRKNGLIFMNALRRHDLPLSQLLTRDDRGANPRPKAALLP